MERRVLVPHDGSVLADTALRFALRTFPDAAITVLHVIEPFPDHTAAGVEDSPGSWRRRAEAHAESILSAARSTATEYDRSVDTVWRYGRPRHSIVQFIDDDDVDHVVMGSHGRDQLSRLLLGSVAEAVVHRSTVPVTIVRGDESPE